MKTKKKRHKSLLLALVLLLTNLLTSQVHSSSFYINLLTKKLVASTDNSNDTIYDPFIRVFLPTNEKNTGRAVLICPGGGYGMVALNHEGYSWANYFNEQGIAAIVLKYRLPNGNCNIPISDAKAAFKIVEDSAVVWNINPDDIGIMGFSAGGHLAATIATHSQAPLKPKFQILFYPVITMDKTYTQMGTHNNLLGKDACKKLEELYSNEKQVTKETPLAFVALAADDQVVPPANGINYFQALIKNNIYSTLHVYPTGGHGWGFNESYKFHNEVLSELSLWLNEIKIETK